LGFPEIDDLNGPEKFGAGRLPMNIENGTRLSTALTYLTDERTIPEFQSKAGFNVRAK
jgi:hypothetical protein